MSIAWRSNAALDRLEAAQDTLAVQPAQAPAAAMDQPGRRSFRDFKQQIERKKNERNSRFRGSVSHYEQETCYVRTGRRRTEDPKRQVTMDSHDVLLWCLGWLLAANRPRRLATEGLCHLFPRDHTSRLHSPAAAPNGRVASDGDIVDRIAEPRRFALSDARVR
jgi:hypothetical protein